MDIMDYVAICPACGNPIDFCQGHGQMGDPRGALILDRHDDGDHEFCHTDADCQPDDSIENEISWHGSAQPLS